MPYQTNKLQLGSAYYPEHWPEDRWPEDIRLMKAAEFTVARVGEFAWSTFEPQEDEYNFKWMDRAIELLAENDIETVMSTPTAAPPAWLTQKYPATLARDENGRQYEHGRRCHYCVNSLEYHNHTQKIVTAMAEHFGANPNIIGWQFDNEYGTICYCDTCRAKFQEYLQEKFQSLEELNEKWSTAYWSQTYFAWDQIPTPKAGHNPGLMLAWQQFVTNSYRQFQKIQIDALRPHITEAVWVTHNFMKWYPKYDHYELSADLDVVSWDWYVGSGHNDFTESGAAHELVRGFKRQNFWLMETQPANVNWAPISNQTNKGECRAMAWHAVAHGADAVLYWQWRSALNGQEQYHGSLVDQSGQPRPFYDEAAQIGEEFSKVSELLVGSNGKARVAILNDYNSRWSVEWQRQHKDFDYVQHLLHYYKPFAAKNIPVDIISADESLSGYRIVIAPAMVILTPERVEHLTEFVKRRGTLIITPRFGMKDEFNSLLPMRQPGALAELANVEVEEYYPLETPVSVKGNFFNGVSRLWAERLRIIDETAYTQSVATYGQHNGWLDDQIAITYNAVGMGGIYYLGVYLDENAQAKYLEHVCAVNGIKSLMITPRGVEVCQRITPEGQKVFILINHEVSPKKVAIPWEAHEYLSGFTGKGQLTMAPYGVAILTKTEG
jgi:beta-galactosidase